MLIRHSIANLIFLAIIASHVNAGAAKGNVLLIIADDYGVDISSLYSYPDPNSPEVLLPNLDVPPTPSLETLAADGIVFENAWSNPTCSPTRANIFTGRYSFRTGVGAPVGPFSPPEAQLQSSEIALAEAIDTAPQLGYATAKIGKWHMSAGSSDPNIIGGWDHYSGSLFGFSSLGFPDTYTNWKKTVDGVDIENYSIYATTDHVNDAINWIQQQYSTDAPWVLALTLTAPHDPFHLPPLELHDYDYLPNTAEDIQQNPRPYYEAMIQAMDTEIGRLLNYIDLEETTVIFVGDNGTPIQLPPPFDSPGKGSILERGVHVPFIVSGKAVTRFNQGSRTNHLVSVTDIYASVLELIGVDINEAIPEYQIIDSVSFTPYLSSQFPELPKRPWVYTEQFVPEGATFPINFGTFGLGRAIRNQRFKLIILEDGQEFFFNLKRDPYETQNLLDFTLDTIPQINYNFLKKTVTQLINSEL